MASEKKPRLHILMNGVFGSGIGGGDIHCFEMARAAMQAGYEVIFWGGHALSEMLAQQELEAAVVLTDRERQGKINSQALPGQFRLFADYLRRFVGTMRRLSRIEPADTVYAASDYWFDVLPAVASRAHRKLMIWHMQAPSLAQIIFRSRADVDAARLASLHYWASQNLSVRIFRFCRNKRIFYVHPAMRQRLLAMGYRDEEAGYLSFGMSATPPAGSEVVRKVYDACWIGRVHRQKGIDDLLQALSYLAKNLDTFRAVLIGNVRAELEPKIKELGLERSVEFSGFVSEIEKFRLFRSSRVFLMPSRFEGSPRVIGEALLCGLPVVAYEVETYRAVFGELVHYVPAFDVDAFVRAALEAIREARSGRSVLPENEIKRFIEENSWEVLRRRFVESLPD